MGVTTFLHKPRALRHGDRVAVIAPASPFDRLRFESGVQRLRSWGFEVCYRDDIFAKKRYLAGDDARRFDELMQFLQDDSIKAVFAARGGYGSLRLLGRLSQAPRPAAAKIFVGYSDLTSLMMFLYQSWGWVTFHGPVVAGDISDAFKVEGQHSLLKALTCARPLGEMRPARLGALYPGKSQGPLVGGCLSLVVRSLGTMHQLETRGKILYLEDVGEKLYAIDRMLTHLRLAGLFDSVAGIVFGPLKDAHEDPSVLDEFLTEFARDLKVPALRGFPSGHVADSWTIPLGLPVILDAQTPSLNFIEAALKA